MTINSYFIGKSGKRYRYAEIARLVCENTPETLGKHISIQLAAIGLREEMEGGVTPCGLPFTFASGQAPRRKQLTSTAMFHTPGLFRALQNDYRIKGKTRRRAVKILGDGYGLAPEEARGLLSGSIPAEIDEAAGTVTYATCEGEPPTEKKKRIVTNPVVELSEDEFDDRYPLLTNHLNPHASWALGDGPGCLFETYGEEREFVRQQDPCTVWTLIDGDGEQCLLSGFHVVNRVGYLVSTVPVPDGMEIRVRLARDEEPDPGPEAMNNHRNPNQGEPYDALQRTHLPRNEARVRRHRSRQRRGGRNQGP